MDPDTLIIDAKPLADEKWIPILLFLGHVLFVAPWIYISGAGEPDSMAMITGIYQGALQQTWFSSSLYMLIGQPFYYAVYFLLQRVFSFSFDQLALAMNISAALCSAGITVLIYVVCRKSAGRAGALFAAVLYISSPTVFEYSTYTHPVTLSLFFLLLGMYFTVKAQGSARAGAKFLWLMAAALSGGAAIGSRADVVILFHLFLLIPMFIAWKNEGRLNWKPGIAGGFVALAAGVFGVMGLASVNMPTPDNEAAGIMAKLTDLAQSFYKMMPLRDGLLELAFGVGVAGSFTIVCCLVDSLARRRWLMPGLLLLLIMLPLLFAMGNPQPARRFLHAVLAMAFAASLIWENLSHQGLKRWGAAVAIGAAVINLATLPALGRILETSGFDVKGHSLLHRAVSSITDHHRANQQYLYTVERQMQGLRISAPENSLLIGGFVNMYFLMASYSKDARPAIATFPERRPGFVLGKLTSGNEQFLLAEYHRDATFSLPDSITHIYKFGELLPRDLPTTIPVTDLAPKPEDSFQMWFRPYFPPDAP